MALVVTAVLFSLVLVRLAQSANTRFSSEMQLPMQWGLNGIVTWSAPRRMALAFMPALSIAVFANIVFLSRNLPTQPGEEGMGLPALAPIGFMFLAIQQFHFWMIEKTLHGNGG